MIVEKTSGVWNVNGHWVRAGNGQAVAYDDSLEVIGMTLADVVEVIRRITDDGKPVAHRGQIKDFGSGPMISKVDYNCWTPAQRPALWAAVDAAMLAKYRARMAAVE